MPAVLLPEGKQSFQTATGAPLVGGKLFTYDAGTSNPRTTWSDAAKTAPNANPVIMDARGEATIFWDGAYRVQLQDSLGSIIWTVDNVSSLTTSLAQNLLPAADNTYDLGSIALAWRELYLGPNHAPVLDTTIGIVGYYPRTAAEIAAGVTPTYYCYPELNLRRYGGAHGAGDNTAAMDAAESVIAQYGAGEIFLDTAAVWKMNWICTTRGCVIRGVGGRAAYDLVCIRPFSLASAPLTFGDGATDCWYCGLINVHVSGTDGTAGSDRQVAKSAPHCLRLLGGVVGFLSLASHYYNGVKTISMEPSATKPVTGARFIAGSARNDISDSASARTIYAKRPADPGYYTDNVFIGTKLNGPGDHASGPAGAVLGYLAEFDGTGGPGIAAEFDNCYADVRADFASPATVCHGIFLKSNAAIKCRGLTLDPGTTAAAVIETDQALGDIGRFVVGELRHGGQKMVFSGAVAISIPAEADYFTYKHRLHTPTTVGQRYQGVAGNATAYPTTIYWELQSTTGPDALLGADLAVKTVGNGLRVAEGANGRQGVSTLVAGAVIVANTSVTANSRIFTSRQNTAGAAGHLSVSRTPGVSFTITSSSGTDTSDVAWEIFEPA